MLKKLIVLTLAISLVIPISAFAATFEYGYWGTTSESEFLTPDGTNHDDYWIDVTVEGAGKGYVKWLGRAEVQGQQNILGTSAVPATVTAPSGAIWMQLVSEDGGEIYATIAHSTNPNSDTTIFTKGSSSGGSDSGGSGGGGSNSCTITNSCDVFNCPNWDEYMGKVDQIISKIPSEPNWQKVAETFRDTIAPRIKADMTDVINDTLGRAPNLPAAADQPSGLNDRGIEAPTGKEADGLGDSSFSSDDIKNGADNIKVREDDSGGFNIENPLESIEDPPKDNVPVELENKAPEPVEPDNKAPEPIEPDNEAPSPVELENEAPSPIELENEAPTPKDESAEAPTPSNDDDWTPPMPDNGNWDAPMPSDSDWTPPIPSN